MKIPILIGAVSILGGCATGATVMLSGATPESPTAGENVEILEEPLSQPHDVVAVVSGNAYTSDYFTLDRAERAALQQLKAQAAEAGADAIMELSREGLKQAEVVDAPSLASLFRYESVLLRGKAIKFTEPQAAAEPPR